eukprot:336951-Amphidinium_carterae.1
MSTMFQVEVFVMLATLSGIAGSAEDGVWRLACQGRGGSGLLLHCVILHAMPLTSCSPLSLQPSLQLQPPHKW